MRHQEQSDTRNEAADKFADSVETVVAAGMDSQAVVHMTVGPVVVEAGCNHPDDTVAAAGE